MSAGRIQGAPKARWETFLAWALLIVGFVVLCAVALRGWIPHDEGALGQAASRVLEGQVPHVDFHDTYGGLQAYVHAGAFQLLGESLRSLRIVNIAIAAVAGYAAFSLVKRVRPILLAASSALATWLIGFAVYPASMPSWWNVALGLAAVNLFHLWWIRGNERWLVAAGLLTGVSFLVKSTGAFLGIAITLFLLMAASATSSRRRTIVGLGWLLTLSFAVLVASALSVQTFILLLLPLGLVVYAGFRDPTTRELASERHVTIREPVVFVASALFPLVVFVSAYLWSGDAAALATGWFQLPRLRLQDAVWAIAVPPINVAVLVVAGLVVHWVDRRLGPRLAYGTLAVVLVLVAVFGWVEFWRLALTMIVVAPLVVSVGMVRASHAGKVPGEHLLLAISLTAFAFIQFPHSNAIYAIYLVPWAAAALSMRKSTPQRGRATAVLVILLSSIVAIQLVRGHLYLATPLVRPIELIALDSDRGGILIAEQDQSYVDLTRSLAAYEGTTIYAGPDAPEIYFLAGARNETPVLFDFLSDDWAVEDLTALLLGHRVKAVVVNRSPDFSAPLSTTLLQDVAIEYPTKSTFGQFDIYESRDGSSED